MKMRLTVAIAFVSLLAVGGSALAETQRHRIVKQTRSGAHYNGYAVSPGYGARYYESYGAADPFYGTRNEYYASPLFYGTPGIVPFNAYASEVPGWGRSDVDASEPGFNPSLDRAKGSLW